MVALIENITSLCFAFVPPRIEVIVRVIVLPPTLWKPHDPLVDLALEQK